MIPYSRILVSFQSPPGSFLKKETKLFLCLFDLNFDFDSKFDNFVFFCLGREARMQGKHVITRQLPYHGLRCATQHNSLLFFIILRFMAARNMKFSWKEKICIALFKIRDFKIIAPLRGRYPYSYFGGVPLHRCQTFETIFVSFSEIYSLSS